MSLSAHHAYMVAGISVERVVSFVEKEANVSAKANPDFFVASYGSFGVDNARQLIVLQSRKAARGKGKWFVVGFETITHEAQNALLKVLEEPTAFTRFFLVVPNTEVLLETVRSRLEELALDGERVGAHPAESFLAASAGKRLEVVSEIIKEKDKTRARELLDGIERVLYEKNMSVSRAREVLREIPHLRVYVGQRGGSLKLVLEHIALVAPRIK